MKPPLKPLDILAWLFVLTLALLMLARAMRGECPEVPPDWGRTHIYDRSCKVFQKIHRDGKTYIVTPGHIELIDCSKAVLVEGGWMEYQAKTVDASFYCYTPKRKKK